MAGWLAGWLAAGWLAGWLAGRFPLGVSLRSLALTSEHAAGRHNRAGLQW